MNSSFIKMSKSYEYILIILDNDLKFETSIYSIEVYLMESNTLDIQIL